MHREMRKQKRQLSEKESIEIIETGEYGVLATTDPDNQPYAVPLNYVYHNGKIYFHCAKTGHKTDNIRHNPNVSFCIVGKNEIISKKFTTGFESVVLFGKAREAGDSEKEDGLVALVKRFSGNHMSAGKEEIKKAWNATTVIVIDIEHMTGKASRKNTK